MLGVLVRPQLGDLVGYACRDNADSTWKFQGARHRILFFEIGFSSNFLHQIPSGVAGSTSKTGVTSNPAARPIDMRPGFAAVLERIAGNGVRTIIAETASRFARDLMVQEVSHAKLRERGIDLIAADSPCSFIDATPTAKLVRQVLGAI
jgi:Resolvase, N terminal domain